VINQLQEEFQAAGKLSLFHALRPFLTTDKGEVSYQEVADQLGMGLNTVRTSIFRLRQKYARTFRSEIARTVGEECDVDEEIRALLSSLAS
jgi:DNA-directed RNA polymerase specialized sigma24 family protein